MADRAEPETPQSPADSLIAVAHTYAEAPSTAEISAPVLDVHASHRTVNTWKDFFIHIATISVGLLIAIGLEQTVELFHHRHQRQQLEEDLQREGLRNREIVAGGAQPCRGSKVDFPQRLSHHPTSRQ